MLLLEAGDDERKFFRIRMPLAWRDAFRDPRLSWGFESEPEPHADGRRVPAPRGKVLGGSNSVNGLMYMRGCPADYDDWAKRGLPGWDYAGVLPYFRRSESNWRGASRFHGGTGPLTTARYETDDFIYPRIIDTAETLGFKHLEDFHAEDIEGFSVPDCNYHGGERASTVARFLRPAMSRPTSQVRINTLRARAAARERPLRGRARRVGRAGRRRSAASAKSFSAAGAFNSPQLLQLSGIGAPQDLEPHGIRVRHALPGVGANLQDHQSTERGFRGQRRILLRQPAAARPAGAVGAAVEDVPQRHPRRARRSPRRDWCAPRPHLDRPDLQMLVSPVSIFARPWFPGWRKGVGHTVSNACVLLHPESRGKVSLRSADPRDKPKIQLNLLQAEADRTGLRNIVKFVRRFFATAPASSWWPGSSHPDPQVQSDADIDAWLRASVRTAMHPTSTCAMGMDGMAVVDGQLRVHGLSGLRIADASIMPAIVGGNTNAPTIMIAEKAADLIRGTGV